MLGVLYKTRIEALSRCSRAATAKKCAKKRDARAKLPFCQSKPIAFFPARPRCRRRRCCSSSLLRIHLSVAEAVENQSWHWALRSDKGIHCIGFNLHWFPQTSLSHFNLGQVPFEFCSKAKRNAISSEMVLRDQVRNISPWAKCWRMADRHHLIEVANTTNDFLTAPLVQMAKMYDSSVTMVT